MTGVTCVKKFRIAAAIAAAVFLPDKVVNAQFIREWGMGPSVIYNIPNAGELGFGLRAHLIHSKELTFSPQFAWFPGFHKYREIYLGVGVHYNTTADYTWGLYGLAYAGWNRFFNYADFTSEKSRPHNLALEPGAGVVRNRGCVRPFGEARYDIKWNEVTVRVGVLLFFGYCRSTELCPPVYK